MVVLMLVSMVDGHYKLRRAAASLRISV
jgi:hypothetical protein